VGDIATGCAVNVTCEVKVDPVVLVPLGAVVADTAGAYDLYGALHVAEDTTLYGSLSPSALTCITHGRNSRSYHPPVSKDKLRVVCPGMVV
jgi:hypothetical protein